MGVGNRVPQSQRNTPQVLIPALLALLSAAQPASAGEDQKGRTWLTADRYSVIVGGYFPQSDTDIRVDGSNGLIGSSLDLEDDLNIDRQKMLFNFGVTRRIREKHRVEFEWFNLRRDGFTVLQEEIVFDGTDFQIDATIDSFLDTDIFRIGYAYSLIREPKKEFGVHAGLHVTEIGVGIRELDVNGDTTQTEDTFVTAPLPVVGLQGAWNFAGRWSVHGRWQLFRLEFDDYKGALDHFAIYLEHATFHNVGLGLGYDYFHVDLKITDPPFLGHVDWDYGGPSLYVHAHF